ncbi:unnamed protein product [Cladocopium goreaui]|uniref:EF-hand domain-containing protein n=1 Tax=Cladocopium goreaui TaxID=2562237 RepID=A0A9P1D0B1_9DINO|nr:unnamed protein product [Cladocopium goreaui]
MWPADKVACYWDEVEKRLKSEQYIDHVRSKMFVQVDQDQDGRVSFEEAKALICKSLSCAADLTKAPGPTRDEVRLAFDAHDTLVEGRGRMGVEEFVNLARAWAAASEVRKKFLGSVFQESLENCAHRLRSAANRLSAPDQWILFVSPFAVDAAAVDLGFVQALRTALLRRHPEGPEAMAAGSAARGEDGRPAWTARSIKYRFYKVQYRYLAHGTLQGPLTPEDGAWTCLLGDASSGTRLYRPGVLQALLKKTVALDVATLMVELDLLAKPGHRRGALAMVKVMIINHYCYYYGVVVDDAAGDVGIASSPESVVAQVGRFSAWTKAPSFKLRKAPATKRPRSLRPLGSNGCLR